MPHSSQSQQNQPPKCLKEICGYPTHEIANQFKPLLQIECGQKFRQVVDKKSTILPAVRVIRISLSKVIVYQNPLVLCGLGRRHAVPDKS